MKIAKKIEGIFEQERFVEDRKPSRLKSKLIFQMTIAFCFLILSIANVIAQSYGMLILTMIGCIANAVFGMMAWELKNTKICEYSSILLCSMLFVAFVINGGNDGFACLWLVLLPQLSMIIMDFKFGFYTGVFFQIFLVAVFWTPLSDYLFYDYNEQFCLRFPLFFFISFMLGFLLTISLQNSEYNEYRHLAELEQVNQKMLSLARIDPLTKLANRRYSYEVLNSNFSEDDCYHCIVMGDIDDFKKVNDLFGHEFGDEVLETVSQYIVNILPDDYLKSRWGGEEFLFAANAAPDVVYEQVEKLRKAISLHLFSCNSVEINVTMTFGLAEYTDKENLAKAITLADKRLYSGKNLNKNRTVYTDQPSV